MPLHGTFTAARSIPHRSNAVAATGTELAATSGYVPPSRNGFGLAVPVPPVHMANNRGVGTGSSGSHVAAAAVAAAGSSSSSDAHHGRSSSMVRVNNVATATAAAAAAPRPSSSSSHSVTHQQRMQQLREHQRRLQGILHNYNRDFNANDYEVVDLLKMFCVVVVALCVYTCFG